MKYIFLKQDSPEQALKKLGIYLRQQYTQPGYVFEIDDVMGALAAFFSQPTFKDVYYSPKSLVYLSLREGTHHADDADTLLMNLGLLDGNIDEHRHKPWAILVQFSIDDPQAGLITSEIPRTSVEERKRYTAPFPASLQ